VERLLALARLDAGADTVRAQEVDVNDLAAQCVSIVKPLADARDVSLKLYAETPITVHTDPNKLREIITNLLHNAVEYNKPHGRIDVSVERNNGHLQVHVSDTGVGISPKSLGHIFERFYRVDESRQADSLHAGLGLAIVKSYLDVLGGNVSVKTIEGEGSTFTIQLPVKSL
jgi:signal transduction histidine kinase